MCLHKHIQCCWFDQWIPSPSETLRTVYSRAKTPSDQQSSLVIGRSNIIRSAKLAPNIDIKTSIRSIASSVIACNNKFSKVEFKRKINYRCDLCFKCRNRIIGNIIMFVCVCVIIVRYLRSHWLNEHYMMFECDLFIGIWMIPIFAKNHIEKKCYQIQRQSVLLYIRNQQPVHWHCYIIVNVTFWIKWHSANFPLATVNLRSPVAAIIN